MSRPAGVPMTAAATAPAPARPQWSEQQVAIFEHFARRRESLVVRARAGTGKTTTILEALNYAPERRALLCAFNKRIADELKLKLRKPGAFAKTLHGVGFGIVARTWRGVQVDKHRGARIAAQVVGEQEPAEVLAAVAGLADKAKEVAPHATAEGLVDVAYEFHLDLDEEEYQAWPVERIAAAAARCMARACERDGTVGFADMLYLPLALGLTRPTWPLVVVDEAQDMGPSQLELARRIVQRDGRVVVVGDDRQAIYKFRGADSESLDRMRDELKARELGLSITYRCPRRIVELAAKIVPDYQAAPTAPEGEVREIREGKLFEHVAPGDFVLSRTNAPIARVALALLRRGVRARIEGKDIAQGLRKLVERQAKRGGGTIEGMLEQLDRWRTRELAKAQAAKRDERATYVLDQHEAITELSEDVDTVAELLERLEELFADDGRPAVVCSTVHKAKGLEARRVFVLKRTLRESTTEESNIKYVAITRAQEVLTWVD